MKTSLSAYALLAGIAALSVAGTMFHYGLLTFASTAKTLRCEIAMNTNSDAVWKGQTIPPNIQTQDHYTVVWRIDGDRWTALTLDGTAVDAWVRQNNVEFGSHTEVLKGGQWSPLKVTNHAYVLWDETGPGKFNFISIDRTTGDVSGSSYSATSNNTFRSVTTGHCTPVTGPIL
jgi:hypothetical protein